MDDDLPLLRDCLAGRPGAWEALTARFTPLLADACRRALRHARRPAGPQEVDDAIQRAFLAFLQEDMRVLRRYQGKGPLAAYLAAVTVRQVFEERVRAGQALPEPSAAPPDPRPGPPEALEARETGASLARELERLPPRARLALALQTDGASLREIGEALGISSGAAGQILSRAKAALRENLKEIGN